MGVIRETNWIDGDNPNVAPFELLLGRVVSGEYQGRCIVCGADQPHDVNWPSFAIELERKSDGESSGDIELSACPSCESTLDALLEGGA